MNCIIYPLASKQDRASHVLTICIEPEDLKTIFQRALNTWADAPPYLLLLSDELDQRIAEL